MSAPPVSADWRQALTVAVEVNGSRWTVRDLLGVVAHHDAGLVDVVGWLSDELRMGHMQHVLVWPQVYERVPGAPTQRYRIER